MFCCRARAGTAVRSGAPGLCGESPQARAAAMFLSLAQRLLPMDPGQQAAASSQQLAPPAPLQRIALHQEGMFSITINHPTLRALTTLQVLFLTDFHSFSKGTGRMSLPGIIRSF